jgi:hypothetical protein
MRDGGLARRFWWPPATASCCHWSPGRGPRCNPLCSGCSPVRPGSGPRSLGSRVEATRVAIRDTVPLLDGRDLPGGDYRHPRRRRERREEPACPDLKSEQPARIVGHQTRYPDRLDAGRSARVAIRHDLRAMVVTERLDALQMNPEMRRTPIYFLARPSGCPSIAASPPASPCPGQNRRTQNAATGIITDRSASFPQRKSIPRSTGSAVG